MPRDVVTFEQYVLRCPARRGAAVPKTLSGYSTFVYIFNNLWLDDD